jgi:hypothetical protein
MHGHLNVKQVIAFLCEVGSESQYVIQMTSKLQIVTQNL